MRKDMAKVVVERGRRGAGPLRPRPNPKDLEKLDELPRHIGMIQEVRERGGYKELNETLQPLYRFIKGQVNRPWNKVHSELREHIKPGNTVQEHVMTHIEDVITLKVDKVPPTPEIPTGLVARSSVNRWRGSRPIPAGELYVDDDGIIKKARNKTNPRPKRGWNMTKKDKEDAKTEREANAEEKLLDADLWGRRIEGIWYGYPLVDYTIEMREVAYPSHDKNNQTRKRMEAHFIIGGRAHRFWHGQSAYNSAGINVGGKYRLKGERRQLSSKELKQYNLKNKSVK